MEFVCVRYSAGEMEERIKEEYRHPAQHVIRNSLEEENPIVESRTKPRT